MKAIASSSPHLAFQMDTTISRHHCPSYEPSGIAAEKCHYVPHVAGRHRSLLGNEPFHDSFHHGGFVRESTRFSQPMPSLGSGDAGNDDIRVDVSFGSLERKYTHGVLHEAFA